MNRKDKKYRGTHCINCETSLDVSEKYCHHCGQLNSTKKLTIKDFIEEFLQIFMLMILAYAIQLYLFLQNQVF